MGAELFKMRPISQKKSENLDFRLFFKFECLKFLISQIVIVLIVKDSFTTTNYLHLWHNYAKLGSLCVKKSQSWFLTNFLILTACRVFIASLIPLAIQYVRSALCNLSQVHIGSCLFFDNFGIFYRKSKNYCKLRDKEAMDNVQRPT